MGRNEPPRRTVVPLDHKEGAMNAMELLPVYDGSLFVWRGNVGWTTMARLDYSFEPVYVGRSDELGFLVKSPRTGATRIFLYKESLRDEDGNFEGTRWESLDGRFEIQVEWVSW